MVAHALTLLLRDARAACPSPCFILVEYLFWICAAALCWTYVGFPAGMIARARSRRKKPNPTTGIPSHRVSVLLAVRNEARTLEQRVRNLLSQDYPICLLDVYVICNGCTDDTLEIANRLAAWDRRVHVLESVAEHGKAGALNAAAGVSSGDIFVFADARQRFAPDAIRRLASRFEDPAVGAVTGRLVIGRSARNSVEGFTTYWDIETRLRQAESDTGSVIGATGAIYAVRRALYVELPPGIILDDVFLPMSVVKRGYRVVMEPAALAFDEPSASSRGEYRRRVRTLAGNLELLRLLPWLLSPRRNPVFPRYLSHKVLRVISPVLFLLFLVSAAVTPGGIYRLAAVSGAALVLLGVVGFFLPARWLALPSAFVLVQTAGLEALLRRRAGSATLWRGRERATTANVPTK